MIATTPATYFSPFTIDHQKWDQNETMEAAQLKVLGIDSFFRGLLALLRELAPPV